MRTKIVIITVIVLLIQSHYAGAFQDKIYHATGL